MYYWESTLPQTKRFTHKYRTDRCSPQETLPEIVVKVIGNTRTMIAQQILDNLQAAVTAPATEIGGSISLEPFYDTTETIYLTADTCYLEGAVTYRFLADCFHTSSPTKLFLLDCCVTADSLTAVQSLVAEKLGSDYRIARFWVAQACPF
jgi:hypothetical protein